MRTFLSHKIILQNHNSVSKSESLTKPFYVDCLTHREMVITEDSPHDLFIIHLLLINDPSRHQSQVFHLAESFAKKLPEKHGMVKTKTGSHV